MIIRGTTPYHSFVLPIAAEDIKEIYITYSQNGIVVIDKGLSDVEIHNVLVNEKGFVIDTNMGDELPENNSFPEEEIITSSQATVHLTQEDTLAFTFWPAAEKNIAIVQIRILDTNDEAYASEPIRERIFGVIHKGVIGGENEAEQSG